MGSDFGARVLKAGGHVRDTAAAPVDETSVGHRALAGSSAYQDSLEGEKVRRAYSDAHNARRDAEWVAQRAYNRVNELEFQARRWDVSVAHSNGRGEGLRQEAWSAVRDAKLHFRRARAAYEEAGRVVAKLYGRDE